MDPITSPEEIDVLRKLAQLYAATYCDACRGLPTLPLERCPACLEHLETVKEIERYRARNAVGQS